MHDQLTDAYYDWASKFCGISGPAKPTDGDDSPFDPPPPVGVAEHAPVAMPAPSSQLPPSPAEQAWIDAGDNLSHVDSQITSFEVVCTPKAAELRKSLDAIEAQAAVDQQEDAVKAAAGHPQFHSVLTPPGGLKPGASKPVPAYG